MAHCAVDDLGGDAGVDECWHATVIDGRACKTTATIVFIRCRRERKRQIAPVNQITAHRVPPVDALMPSAQRVVLIKHVHLPLPLNEAIGIIQPVGRRQKVKGRAMQIIAKFGAIHKLIP